MFQGTVPLKVLDFSPHPTSTGLVVFLNHQNVTDNIIHTSVVDHIWNDFIDFMLRRIYRVF
jgi:hypothetical protein